MIIAAKFIMYVISIIMVFLKCAEHVQKALIRILKSFSKGTADTGA